MRGATAFPGAAHAVLRHRDFDSLDDGAVTVRERDAMIQGRISLDRVEDYLVDRLGLC